VQDPTRTAPCLSIITTHYSARFPFHVKSAALLSVNSSTPLGHVQRLSASRLQAGNFAKTSSSWPADGRAVASPEDGRVPCSEAGRDNVAPLYNPPRSTGRALGSRANNSYSRHTKDFCAPNPSPPLLPASLFALAPNPSPSPAYSARVGSKRRAARCGGGEEGESC
jgi:hypothetical protein